MKSFSNEISEEYLIKSFIERIFKPKKVIDWWFVCKSFQLNVHLEPAQFRKDCENIYDLIGRSQLKEAQTALAKAYQDWGFEISEFAKIESMIRIKAICLVRE
jgi:hypothetical protein